MSSVVQDELSTLTDDQLRSRLLQFGLANMPITATTRKVLVGKLRKAIEGQKSAPRRETMHVTKYPTDEEKAASKPGPASRKVGNRRNTINATPMTSDDIVPIVKPTKNMSRSGRITPTFNENGNSIAPIAVQPSEDDIIELDEEPPARETYVLPKRTSRSPSLGKSQTVVTSYKTEVAKPIAIIESNEEDDDDEEDESSGSSGQYKIYPSLPTNGFKNLSPTKTSLQSTLRRTTTHTTAYEPSTYKPLYEDNYVPFKAPLSRPIVPTYSGTASSSSVNRRYTTNSFNSKQRYDDDDSATEHSDIDAPYLSDFAKRLSQLRPEPLDRKIIADVKQNHIGNDSLWLSFSNLVAASARKFGTIILAGGMLLIVVFIYVFFIMA